MKNETEESIEIYQRALQIISQGYIIEEFYNTPVDPYKIARAALEYVQNRREN